MSKKPNPGKCVHCLQHFKSLTWDHVLPKAWYPNTNNPDEYKWQVPSCQDCNKRYGKLENDLLTRISLCLDPNDQNSLGMFDKGMRAINPKYGKNEKDRNLRKAKKNKLSNEIEYITENDKIHLYPNFNQFKDVDKNKIPIIKTDAKNISQFAEKIVRGFYFLNYETFIESPYFIETLVVSDQDFETTKEEFYKNFDKSMVQSSRNPAIVIDHIKTSDDDMISISFITIWKRFKFVSFVRHKSDV